MVCVIGLGYRRTDWAKLLLEACWFPLVIGDSGRGCSPRPEFTSSCFHTLDIDAQSLGARRRTDSRTRGKDALRERRACASWLNPALARDNPMPGRGESASDLEGRSCGITRGQSDPGSSPWSRRTQSHGQTSSASPPLHRPRPGPGAGSLNRRPDRHGFRST